MFDEHDTSKIPKIIKDLRNAFQSSDPDFENKIMFVLCIIISPYQNKIINLIKSTPNKSSNNNRLTTENINDLFPQKIDEIIILIRS